MQGPGNTELDQKFPFCNKFYPVREQKPRVKVAASICPFQMELADISNKEIIWKAEPTRTI